MDFLRQPVFLVGDIDKDINFSLPPCSGEEYIRRVMIEARQCADVVVADIDSSCMTKPRKGYIKPLAGCVQAPPELRPTIEWQEYQVSEFSTMRLYVSRFKDEIRTSKREWKPFDLCSLPDASDEDAWIELCSSSDGDQRIRPTLSTLFSFDPLIVEQLLEYLVRFVETERKIEYRVGQWIYALLVILEQPLHPDTCSCLRSLARACSVIRADSREPSARELGALNLFVCLVARYFRQLDLADP